MKYLSFSAFAIVTLLGVASPLAAYEPGCEPGGASCGKGEHICSPGEPDERNLTRHCCYVNAYGKEVHAPGACIAPGFRLATPHFDHCAGDRCGARARR